MTDSRKLTDNGLVEIIETRQVPRYSLSAATADWETEGVIEHIKESCFIYCKARDYSGLHNLDIELEQESFDKDKIALQKYLDKTHGKSKYKVLALMVYVHGATRFYIRETRVKVCAWDSGCLGFIAVPAEWTDKDIDNAADMMTDAWEGSITEYAVTDNLNDEIVDSFVEYLHATPIEMAEKERARINEVFGFTDKDWDAANNARKY